MSTPAKKGTSSNGRPKAGTRRKPARTVSRKLAEQPPRRPTAKQLAAGKRLLAELEAEARPVTPAELEKVYQQWDEA